GDREAAVGVDSPPQRPNCLLDPPQVEKKDRMQVGQLGREGVPGRRLGTVPFGVSDLLIGQGTDVEDCRAAVSFKATSELDNPGIIPPREGASGFIEDDGRSGLRRRRVPYATPFRGIFLSLFFSLR